MSKDSDIGGTLVSTSGTDLPLRWHKVPLSESSWGRHHRHTWNNQDETAEPVS